MKYFLLPCAIFWFGCIYGQKKKENNLMGYGHLDFTLATGKQIKNYTGISAGAGLSPNKVLSIGLGIDAFVLKKAEPQTVVPHVEITGYLGGLNKPFSPFVSIEPGISFTDGNVGNSFATSFLLGFRAKGGSNTPGPFATIGFSNFNRSEFLKLSFGLCF